MPPLDVLELMRQREMALRKAHETIKTAQPAIFGGATRHKWLTQNAKAAWLSARIATAQAHGEHYHVSDALFADESDADE